jgi:superfamily II DNA or RNA helicase
MSIAVPISSLTKDQVNLIMKDLQFENTSGKEWVHSFHVDEKKDEIYLPYAYSRKMGFKQKTRENYPQVTYEFTGVLRDYQEEVRKTIFRNLEKTGSIVCSLHVGWGKSLMSIYTATKIKLKTLIILNKLILVDQWKDTIKNVCPNSKYQFVKVNSVLDSECDFYIINAQNVPKMGMDYFKAVGTCIVDELHLICASTLYKALFYITPKYLLGLSATPYRPDGLDRLIDLYFGEFKIDKPLFKHHTVITMHTGFKIHYEFTWDGKMDWNSVLNYQAELTERNQFIIDIITKYSERYFLVLCKRISQGKILLNMLQDIDESVTDLLGSKKDFNKDARIVVATTQKCGVGFSHDKLDALLLASDMEEYFIQYLGRVFRTPDVEPIIFDLVDNLSVLMRHYQTRKKVYIKSGGNIQETSLKHFYI